MTRWCICLGAVLCLLSASEAQEFSYPIDLNQVGLAMPETEDARLESFIREAVYYKLPPAYQHYVPPSRVERTNLTLGTKDYTTTPLVWGLYWATHDPDSHANFNFPWETTIGLNSLRRDKDDRVKTINAMQLPKDASGRRVPVLVLGEYPIKWVFPAGTTVGEIIYVEQDGRKYVQEVRIRTKSDDSRTWEPRMYRPVGNRDELISLANLAEYVPAKTYVHFRNPQEDEVFAMNGLVERLPELSTEQVRELLARPFKDVTVEDWHPMSDQDFHILPKKYCFSLLESVDNVTCAGCHRQTQISVRNLVPKDPDVINDPMSIGNIRGCDGIFTWYPFASTSIKSDVSQVVRSISFRRYDLDNGVIRVVQAKDSWVEDDRYRLTLYVQEALKDYELPKRKSLLHDTTESVRQPER